MEENEAFDEDAIELNFWKELVVHLRALSFMGSMIILSYGMSQH